MISQYLSWLTCLLVCVSGSGYKGHMETLAPAVMELAKLEKRVQTSFIELKYKKKYQQR